MINKLTKSLFAGAAFVALSAIPTMAQASECVWAGTANYGTYKITKPTVAESFISGLYQHKDYEKYYRYCSFTQFKAQFFAENGGEVQAYDNGSVLYVPVPRRIDESDPAPAPEPVNQTSSNPAPLPSDASRPAKEVGEQIADLYRRIDAGGNPAAIEVLKAQIAALEARQPTSVQTVVERQPIHTTKTVVQGLSAAQKAEIEKLKVQADKVQIEIDKINALPHPTAEQLTALDKLTDKKKGIEAKYTALSGRVNTMANEVSDLWLWLYGVAAIALIALMLGFWNLLRKAGKKEVKYVRAESARTREDAVRGVGQLTTYAGRQAKIKISPEDPEGVLHSLSDGESETFTIETASRKAVVEFTKVGNGLVETTQLPDEPRSLTIDGLEGVLTRNFLADAIDPTTPPRPDPEATEPAPEQP